MIMQFYIETVYFIFKGMNGERPTIKSQAKKYFNFLLKKGIANKLVQIQA